MRLALHFSVVACVALGACRSSSGLKGGLVTVPKSEAGQADGFAPRRHALLVGITQLDDPDWRPLKYASKDVADLGNALAAGTPDGFDSVQRLTTRAETTRASILQGIKRLAERANRAGDIAVVYLSAHGTLARDQSGALRRYIVTSDALPREAASTALSVDALETALAAVPSKRRVLILATCHSGSGKSTLPTEVSAELATLKAGFFARPLEESSRASVVLSAADWGEAAREDDSLANDVYTHFLVEALGGVGDRNHDGAVTATEAHDFARRKTWDFSQGRQRPSAEIIEVGADPIVLAGHFATYGDPELYSYAPHLDGVSLRVDGAVRAELPGGAAVSRGGHVVELTKGGETLLRKELTLTEGERLDVEGLWAGQEPQNSVSLIGGGWLFLDEASRDALLPPSAAVGITFKRERLLLNRLALSVDLAGFSSAQQVVLGGQSVPFVGTSLMAGTSLLYAAPLGRFVFAVGPRVAALWLWRSFSLETYARAQSAFSVTPGAQAGVWWHVSDRFVASLEAQLMLSVLTVDGAARWFGFSGAWASVGYRF